MAGAFSIVHYDLTKTLRNKIVAHEYKNCYEAAGMWSAGRLAHPFYRIFVVHLRFCDVELFIPRFCLMESLGLHEGSTLTRPCTYIIQLNYLYRFESRNNLKLFKEEKGGRENNSMSHTEIVSPYNKI